MLNDTHRDYIDNVMARYPGHKAVAIVLNDAGDPYDVCFNWETAQAMAGEYTVIALADDGHMSVDEIQRICDYERRIYIDCFGE